MTKEEVIKIRDMLLKEQKHVGEFIELSYEQALLLYLFLGRK